MQSCADGSFLEFKALEGEPLERIDRQEEQEEEAMLLQKQDVAQEHVAEEQAAFNYEEAMENEALEAEEDEAEDDEDLLEEQHVMKHETEDEEAAAADEEVAAEQQDTTEDEAVYQEEEHEAELSANDIPEAELAEEDEPVEEQAIENIQLDNVDREVLEAERREKENKILAVAAKMDDNKDDQNHQASLASADDHRDNGSSHSGKDGDHGMLTSEMKKGQGISRHTNLLHPTSTHNCNPTFDCPRTQWSSAYGRWTGTR